MNEKIEIPVFRYDSKDFVLKVNENEEESKFDSALREKWEAAEKNNVFRYKLNTDNCKVLSGQYRFLAQLNTNRGFNRRKPESVICIKQPFDPTRFNFTKLPPKEIYFDINDADGNNIIAANVSPIEWGHCLFLPKRHCQLPQIMTEESLLKSVELLLLSRSPNLRIIFNGLCAYASVNHLHWHLYYLKHRMLLETIKVNDFVGPVFTLDDFPSKGFCVQLSSVSNKDINQFAKISYSIVKYLQDNEIAHNVYITRAKCDRNIKFFDNVRIYIWARKPGGYGVKDTTAFTPAVSELFGHLIIKSETQYADITEQWVTNILNEITADIFSSIKDKVKILLNEMLLNFEK